MRRIAIVALLSLLHQGAQAQIERTYKVKPKPVVFIPENIKVRMASNGEDTGSKVLYYEIRDTSGFMFESKNITVPNDAAYQLIFRYDSTQVQHWFSQFSSLEIEGIKTED